MDSKAFWRVDKDQDPELRHTVLTLVAFHDLQAKIEECGSDRERGIAAFLAQNDGQGWLLPETLRLADYGLGHDDRAQHPQPVASRLGPRFLDWQLAQPAEESWRECHLHARNLLGEPGYEALLAQVAGKSIVYIPSEPARAIAAEPPSGHAVDVTTNANGTPAYRAAASPSRKSGKSGKPAPSHPKTDKPNLPHEFRLAAPIPELYAAGLIEALLCRAGGAMDFEALLDAFVLATSPDILVRLAPASDKAIARAWAARWNEEATANDILPALRALGSRNLCVRRELAGFRFELLHPSQIRLHADLHYDAWISLHVAAFRTKEMANKVLEQGVLSWCETVAV